jgi:hypothetical protein
MLQHELRGRELPDDELRRIAEKLHGPNSCGLVGGLVRCVSDAISYKIPQLRHLASIRACT